MHTCIHIYIHAYTHRRMHTRIYAYNTYMHTYIHIFMHSFIHSFRRFLKRPFKSSTTQRRSRLQHGYCIGVSRRSAQAQALGMIRRTIVTRDKDTILRLYKSLVRPQLEYCIQVWSPYLKQDMEKLEKVQRRATKMIQGYKYLSYEERLIRCGLTTL